MIRVVQLTGYPHRFIAYFTHHLVHIRACFNTLFGIQPIQKLFYIHLIPIQTSPYFLQLFEYLYSYW